MITHEINAAIEDVVAAASTYTSLREQEERLEADLRRVSAAKHEAERTYRKFESTLLELILKKE